MSTRTITDRGLNSTSVTFEKGGPGAPSCEVQIRNTAGSSDSVAVDLATALTGSERTALADLLRKVYDAAKVSAGFVG